MEFAVNGTNWTLKWVNPHSEHLRRSDRSFTLGVTDNNVKTVFIADNLSEFMTDKVLCHELTHVFAFENHYYMDIQTEEIVADYLSLFGRGIISIADEIMSNLIGRVVA